MEQIKLRELYEKVYRRRNFSVTVGKKEYTTHVINVTFKYAIKEFNRIRSNIYVKNGRRFEDVVDKLNDSVYVENGDLVAIAVNKSVENPVSEELLGDYFYYDGGHYNAKTNIKTVLSVADIREDLYKNGFYCDGVHYVRMKRSAGSSRVGKCLFIDERLYPRLHKWELCGLRVDDGDDIDLAALEAAVALTTSSIIDTVEIDPESILVVDDYNSVFYDDVIATYVTSDGHLHSKPDNVEVSNSIWDGQSLLDSSMFGKYSQYGMLLLRNRFFKSCCFNTNLQQFFADNDITRIDQLNGFTLAKKLSDIKMVTTPSSIKYIKFGRLRDWLKKIDSIFGIVKHEKKTHFFGGRMVQTHYQLLNTLQMTQEDVDNFLEPSIEYVKRLKTDPAVMRYHLGSAGASQYPLSAPLLNRNDIIFRLLSINDRFAETKIYGEFRDNVVRSYISNIRKGHVLVNGNYSTMVGNPIEMLQESIGKFDGTPYITPGTIFSRRFDYDQAILGSRSPHVCQGNILLTENKYYAAIDKYLNLTDEIVCVNSINDNILQRLSGCDCHKGRLCRCRTAQ